MRRAPPDARWGRRRCPGCRGAMWSPPPLRRSYAPTNRDPRVEQVSRQSRPGCDRADPEQHPCRTCEPHQPWGNAQQLSAQQREWCGMVVDEVCRRGCGRERDQLANDAHARSTGNLMHRSAAPAQDHATSCGQRAQRSGCGAAAAAATGDIDDHRIGRSQHLVARRPRPLRLQFIPAIGRIRATGRTMPLRTRMPSPSPTPRSSKCGTRSGAEVS